MKSTNILFLFLCFYALNTDRMFCQVTDSTVYYSQLIQKPKNDNDLAKSYKFFLKKKDEYSEKGLVKHEIFATQNIADIQKHLGYSGESERLNIECLELLNLLKTDKWSINSKVKTINDLGKIYRLKKDYNEALKIYHKGLKLTNKKSDASIILNNIGFVLFQQNKYQEAVKYFNMAYNNALQSKDTLNMARSLDNLGFAKSKIKKDAGIENLWEALSLRIHIKHISGVITSHKHLAQYFDINSDSSQAYFHSDKAIELAKSTTNIEHVISTLRLKYNLGDDLAGREYIVLRDSLDDLNARDRNNFNYYVYQYDKKEKELQKSELLQERLIYALAFILLASTFLYFFLKFKHKKEKLQQVFHAESRISKKVHDEVANDVFQFMTKLQSEPNSNEQLIDDLEEIYNKTRDISKEHSVLDLKGDFGDVLSDLILSFNSPETNVMVKGVTDISWDAISEIKRTAIYKVLQELLINMKKHSRASIVVFTFDTNRKTILINYSDNGKGSDLKKGSGLQNVENRMASINGTITFESKIDKGFKAKLTV